MGCRAESLVNASLGRELLVLVLPALLMQIVQTAGWLGEAVFVSKLGKVELAAIGLVGELTWLLSTLTTIVTVSATTLVAQKWGAGDMAGVREFTKAAVQQAILFGLLASATWLLRDLIWQGMGAEPSVRRAAEFYLLIALASFPLMNLAASWGAAFRGIGDMRTPFFVSAIATSCHLLANALLTPIWGLKGAAAALAFSRIVALMAYALFIRKSPLNAATDKLVTWDGGYHRELLRLGIPAGAQNFFWAFGSVVFYSLLNRARDGTEAVAAFTAGIRVESVAFMIAMAFGMATQTIVGQSVGAGNWERGWQGTWLSTFWCVIVILPICAVLFFASGWLASYLSTDPTTYRYMAYYLKVAALAEPFWAISMTTGAALQGAGDTRTPALIAILTQWLFCIPLTYLLCVHKGHSPIVAWWLVGASGFLTGAVTAAAFVLFWRKRSNL
ncbi:MATE family efflux transporter [Fervidibacter sacchari]